MRTTPHSPWGSGRTVFMCMHAPGVDWGSLDLLGCLLPRPRPPEGPSIARGPLAACVFPLSGIMPPSREASRPLPPRQGPTLRASKMQSWAPSSFALGPRALVAVQCLHQGCWRHDRRTLGAQGALRTALGVPTASLPSICGWERLHPSSLSAGFLHTHGLYMHGCPPHPSPHVSTVSIGSARA